MVQWQEHAGSTLCASIRCSHKFKENKIKSNNSISLHYLTSEHSGYWFDWWTRWFSVRSILRNLLLQENFEKRRPVNNDLCFAHVSFSVVFPPWPGTVLARAWHVIPGWWKANEIGRFSWEPMKSHTILSRLPAGTGNFKKHCNLWLRWKRNSTETLTRSSSRVIKGSIQMWQKGVDLGDSSLQTDKSQFPPWSGFFLPYIPVLLS